MRILQLLTLVLALALGGVIGVVVGQEKVIAPPRLQIRTDGDVAKPANKSDLILKVEAVAPSGLGAQLGLKPGDIIDSLKVGDNKPMTIKTSADLSRGLSAIRKATLDAKAKDADITLVIFQNEENPKLIEGKIFRTDFFDKTDGGTLYYFRPKKDGAKAAPDKQRR